MAVPALFSALREDDKLLVSAAANALIRVEADPAEAVPALVARVIGEDGRGRPEVVEALAAYGPRSVEAVPALLNRLPPAPGDE